MSVLIIDTSGTPAVIAYAADGKIIESFDLLQGRELSKNLFSYLPRFDKVKFDFIAVGTGPGTFTGTRVGAIIGQALAYGWNIPLISFSSTLLPNLSEIAAQAYASYLKGENREQIELVYISPTS